MKPYLISLAAGLLVGIVYSLLGVRSPAPPTIALVGLLGMLVGEQVIPVAKRMMAGEEVAAFMRTECAEHVLGLPLSSTTDCPAPEEIAETPAESDEA